MTSPESLAAFHSDDLHSACYDYQVEKTQLAQLAGARID
jgi:hypothetical protein